MYCLRLVLLGCAAIVVRGQRPRSQTVDSIFACYNPKLSARQRHDCLDEFVCLNLFYDEICDGLQADCADGADETRLLCQDTRWKVVPCYSPGQIRCSGHRPGQCIDVAKVCDGRYDCIDRSDENYCVDVSRWTTANTTVKTILNSTTSASGSGDEDVKPNSVAWTALLLLLGLPLTWMLKVFLMRWFVATFGTLKDKYKQATLVQRELIPDEDVLKVLAFIKVIVEHVESNEPFERHRRKIFQKFKDVHNTEAWSKSVEIIFDMGHVLFDSQMELIDEFHVVMSELEKMVHKNVRLEMNLCLKHDLGNRMVNDLLCRVQQSREQYSRVRKAKVKLSPKAIRKLQMLVPNCVHVLWRTQVVKTFRIFIGLCLETMAYYLDLVKDWIIFAILYKFIDKTTFFSFEAQLVFMLGVFLVFPEIVRGAVFAHHFKLVLDVSEYKFNHIAQDVLKIVLVILSPFIPAILLWERGKIAYRTMKIQDLLNNRLELYMNAEDSSLEKPMLDTFREDFEQYHKALKDKERILEVVTSTKYLEASTETIFQYILQLLVVLVVRNAVHVGVTQGLETVFFESKVEALLYFSLTISFFSLIKKVALIEVVLRCFLTGTIHHFSVCKVVIKEVTADSNGENLL